MSTKQQIKDIIQDDINDDKFRIGIYERFCGIIEENQGKKITKRIVPQIEKAFPEYSVISYQKKSYYFEVSMWQKSYNDRITIQLSRNNDHFDIEEFSNANTSWGSAAKERIEKNEKYLNDDGELSKIAKAIDAINKAKTILDSYEGYHFPAFYQIDKLHKDKK